MPNCSKCLLLINFDDDNYLDDITEEYICSDCYKNIKVEDKKNKTKHYSMNIHLRDYKQSLIKDHL